MPRIGVERQQPHPPGGGDDAKLVLDEQLEAVAVEKQLLKVVEAGEDGGAESGDAAVSEVQVNKSRCVIERIVGHGLNRIPVQFDHLRYGIEQVEIHIPSYWTV